ncbi:MAG: family 16 glycosylhydrolase [Bythopirellula sp.]
MCRNSWSAPWDPSNDYHIYACENTPEKIVWYIDGKLIFSPGILSRSRKTPRHSPCRFRRCRRWKRLL